MSFCHPFCFSSVNMVYMRSPAHRLDCRGNILRLGSRTLIMGILNVTPDSFADGGRYFEPQQAVERALMMAEEGADIIDVGGESTRPAGTYGAGAQPVSAEEEIRRTAPVIEEIAARTNLIISIDTTKAAVAQSALKLGASIVNDISALRFDPLMGATIAQSGAAVVLMHMRGTPLTMQIKPVYHNLIREILDFLDGRRTAAIEAGIDPGCILIDPGLGFGKRNAHNFEILARLEEFHDLGCPLMVGPSRKKFIGAALDLPPEARLHGTLAAVGFSAAAGAHVVRVHDVGAAVRAVHVAEQIVAASVAGRSAPEEMQPVHSDAGTRRSRNGAPPDVSCGPDRERRLG